MAVSFDPTDPSHLTPDQRLDALVALLATGVRRALALRRSALKSEGDSPPDGLDKPRQQSVHAPRG
jgi:hypothetical protein